MICMVASIFHFDATMISCLLNRPVCQIFFKEISFHMQKLKKLYDYDQVHDLVLYNNREILTDRSSFYYQNWHQGGILSIHDLLPYLPVYKLNPPFWRHFSAIQNFW